MNSFINSELKVGIDLNRRVQELFEMLKMTTTSRKLWHSYEASMMVFKIKNAVKWTWQHAGEKTRKAKYVQRHVCFVNEQVP